MAGTLNRFSTCNSTLKYNRRSNLKSPLLQSVEGRWVFDNISFSLYNESDCPCMSDQLACYKHGRPDLMYQNWRWQPHGCDLKR
ncbi:putative PMR5 domain, trichome birefringence-like family [Helianthus anomalus]